MYATDTPPTMDSQTLRVGPSRKRRAGVTTCTSASKAAPGAAGRSRADIA